MNWSAFLRRARVAPLVLLLSFGLVLSVPTTATASTISGIAQNTWIVSDLAAQGYGKFAAGGEAMHELSAADRALLGSATRTTTSPYAGLKLKPKAGGGYLGLIINTVGTLGGISGLWNPGEGAVPDLPVVQGTTYAGGVCGWSSVGFISATTHGCSGLPANGVSTAQTQFYFCVYSNCSDTMAGDVAGRVRTALLPVGSPPPAYSDSSNVWGWSPLGASTYLTSSPQEYTVYVGVKANGAITQVQEGRVKMPAYGTTIPNPSQSGDPTVLPRYIDSEITCKSPGGGSQVFTRHDGPFTMNPAASTVLPDVPDMVCPAGTWLASGKREIATTGSTTKVPLDEPYVAPDWVEEQASQFPECLPVGSIQCQLKLFKVGTADDPEFDCNSQPGGDNHPCRDWSLDPKRSSTYQCRYGGHTLPLASCDPYAKMFTKTETVQKTPPEGEESTTPRTDVDPTPLETPGLGTCVPKFGLGLLNPWWVFKATGCALQWAFVPQVTLSTRLTRMKEQLDGKAPFSWIMALPALPASIPGSGCPDWVLKTPNGQSKNIICGTQFGNAMRDARPVFAVLMIGAACWPLIRSVMYASFPVVKPHPGGDR